MPTIYTYEQKVIAPVAITDPGLNYFDARNQAATAEEFKGLKLTNMPRLIELLKDEKIAKAIRESYADTISGEFHTTIKDNRVYAAAHGNHPLIAVKRLKEGIKKQDQYGFIPLGKDETKTLFKDMVPIGDVKSGYDASNQTIAINLGKQGYNLIPLNTDMKDVMSMYKAGKIIIFERGQLSEDQFKIDDRVLANCGSEEYRTVLGERFFKKEGRKTAGSYHRIQERSFDQPVGRLVVLGGDNYGILGYDILGDDGRSVGSSNSARGAGVRVNTPLEQLVGKGHIIEGTNIILIENPTPQQYRLLTGKELGG